MKKLALLVCIIVALGGGVYFLTRDVEKKIEYTTTKIEGENVVNVSDNYIVIQTKNGFDILDLNSKKKLNNENYSDVKLISDGIYEIKTEDGKKQLLNIENNKKLDIENVLKIDDRYYIVIKDKKMGVVDKEFQEVLPFDKEMVEQNGTYLIFTANNQKKLYDKNLKELTLDFDYDDIKLDTGKYLNIKKDGKWGIATVEEGLVTLPNYDSFSALNNDGLFLGDIGNDRYLINIDEKIEKLMNYDNFSMESDDRIMVLKDDKIGYIDDKGDEVLPVVYDGGFLFKDNKDFLQVRKGDMWYLLDLKSNKLKPVKFEDVGEYQDELMVVKTGDLYGYIDKDTELVIPVKYTYAENFSNGVAKVGSEYGFGVINKDNEEIIPLVQDDVAIAGDYIFVEKNGKMGLYLKTGVEILPMEYDKLNIFDETSISYKKGEDTGIIKIGEEENGN